VRRLCCPGVSGSRALWAGLLLAHEVRAAGAGAGGRQLPRSLSPQFLAMVFQDLLTNKDDYLRASRALLREIIKQTKHEINFQAFCLGLMQERKEPQYLDMEFKVRGAAPPGHRPRGLCAGCGGGAAVSGVRRPTAPPGPGSAQGGF